MSYSGSTASSTIANPPIQIARGLGGGITTTSTAGSGTGLWLYNTSNGCTEMMAANYFTDGYALGMRSGDIIMGVSCTGSSVGVYMGALAVVTSSGANITSTGGNLSSNR